MVRLDLKLVMLIWNLRPVQVAARHVLYLAPPDMGRVCLEKTPADPRPFPRTGPGRKVPRRRPCRWGRERPPGSPGRFRRPTASLPCKRAPEFDDDPSRAKRPHQPP